MKNKEILLTSLIFFIFTLPLFGDDTDIFSGTSISVEPNVLILLDTSGSMVEDDKKVSTSVYDPSYTYYNDLENKDKNSNKDDSDVVYFIWKEPNKEWEKSNFNELTEDINYITCAEAKSALRTYGYWMGYMSEEPTALGEWPCGDSDSGVMKLYMGNYRNFQVAPDTVSTSEYRETIARGVIKNLIHSLDDTVARMGLMKFDDEDDGGKMVLPIGATDAQFDTVIDNTAVNGPIASKGSTPVAEALAEAGRYFVGATPWASYGGNDYQTSTYLSGDKYISPVQWRCQKNYVIIISDGLSYNDNGKQKTGDTSMFLLPYLNDKTIGDYDGDGVDLTEGGADVIDTVYAGEGTHMLDDTAAFLYNEDLIVDPDGSVTDNAGVSFDHEYFEKQNITTFTVGFMTSSGDPSAMSLADQLLYKTASQGGGEFISAQNSAELEAALLSIVGMIMSVNSSFIAPVVPVNKINKVYSGNSVYLSLFKPNTASCFWYGNLKKFGIDTNGYLLDKNGASALGSGGEIKDTASSCWAYSSSDGSITESGGVGAQIYNQTQRYFYTYSGTTTDLTASSNAFSKTNSAITAEILGVGMTLSTLLRLKAIIQREGIRIESGY